MAKRKNNTSDDENILRDPMTYIRLFRAALDGDKLAIRAANELLDVLEKQFRLMSDDLTDLPDLFDEAFLDDDGDDDEAEADSDDENFDYTLQRDNVREMHIRIKLNNVSIKIWRELKVPSNITLHALGHILQDAVGWDHMHMFEFRKNNATYCDKDFLSDGIPSFAFDYNDFTLSDLLHEKGDRMKFEYDFGDSWVHDVWLKGERDYEPGEQPVLVCLKGRGACPPEDCGGPWRYNDLLELLEKEKLTKEERETLEWYLIDKTYDPEEFDLDITNELLESSTDDMRAELNS